MAAASIEEKLLQLLKLSGYITQMTGQGSGIKYVYGPSGTLLRENIRRSWWTNMVSSRKDSFPVEGNSLELQTFFPEVTRIIGNKRPFSIASHQRENLQPDKKPLNKLLFNSSCFLTLKLAHFCDPSSSRQEFDQLLSARFDWWKRLVGNPAKFTLTDLENDGSLISKCIQYQFPWGLETLETVQNRGDNPLKDIAEVKLGEDNIYPYQIDCQSMLEVAMATFLDDAFTEKKVVKNKIKRQVLKLHAVLAPFKVAVTVSGDTTKELGEVAHYVAKEMRMSGIPILFADDKAEEKTFIKNDAIGIPFTVIISDNTLETGVVGLRNRDTTLQEQLAVSKLVSTVQRNLT